MNIILGLLAIILVFATGSMDSGDPYTKLYIENKCRDRWVYVWIDDLGPNKLFPTERPIKIEVNGRPLDQSMIRHLDFGKHEIRAEAYLKSVFGWYLVGTTQRTIKIDSHLDWGGKYGEVIILGEWSFEECYVRRAPPKPLE